MASRRDPAPLFDLVTGFPPDDALDVTMPLPLSLALYMTMLESTGHAAELAALRTIHIEQARETARALQAGISVLSRPDVPDTARARITHIVDERVPRVNGLRPHIHYFVGTTLRGTPEGAPRAVDVDVDELVSQTDTDVFPDHCARLAEATAQRCGLVWGATSWSDHEVLEPPWPAERAACLRAERPCPGPWPRRQIVVGWPHPDRAAAGDP